MGQVWSSLALDLRAELPETFADERIEALAQRLLGTIGLELPEGGLYRFEPQGTSLVRFGPSGRIALHTWPEHQLATLDLRISSGEALELTRARLVRALEQDEGVRVVAAHRVA